MFAHSVFAQEFNAGFVQGLWFSQEEIFVDTPVRVYVAIRNNTDADLTGTVEFFDNDKRIAQNKVSALNGRIIESWADWEPTYGTHTLSATLSRIELHRVGSSTKAIEVKSALAEKTIFVDYDTDKDGVGNEDDIDDDGDGISDVVEEKNGTDPLEYDEPANTEPETQKDTAQQEADTDTNTEDTTQVSNNPEGLEQYLAPSIAQEALGSFTQFVNTTKQNLDNYREKRDQARTDANKPEEIVVNEDGFGEITRTQKDEKEIQKPELPKVQEGGFFDASIGILGTIINIVYATILGALSFFLGHPMLVQLLILFAILFALYKLAHKFGQRKNR